MGVSHQRRAGQRIERSTPPRQVRDDLAVEEPLEMRIGDGRQVLRSVITMRTPGADLDLVAGWLRGEGIVRTGADLVAVRACTDASLSAEARGNVVTADLADTAIPRLADLSRSTNISGACGVCGADSLDRVLERDLPPLAVTPGLIRAETVQSLPERLRASQRVFDRTGGLHAAACADASGELLVTREDIGRHNAVDKALGWALMAGVSPTALVVSSRASFEIVEKAAASGVPVVITVSAPSTLAVDLAERAGITLAAFVRDGRATLYTHPDRVAFDA
jgi:FdhD protein